MATISATLDKSPLDTSALPSTVKESGLGDVEAQLRWRWSKETDTRPEFFSYFETVFPLQRSKPSDWNCPSGSSSSARA